MMPFSSDAVRFIVVNFMTPAFIPCVSTRNPKQIAFKLIWSDSYNGGGVQAPVLCSQLCPRLTVATGNFSAAQFSHLSSEGKGSDCQVLIDSCSLIKWRLSDKRILFQIKQNRPNISQKLESVEDVRRLFSKETDF